MHPVTFLAFADELLKSAARVPVLHGTSGLWDVLRPGIGGTVGRTDPNPRAVYVAIKNRDSLRGITGFARDAAKAKGGTPLVAHAKIDTKKGWRPFQLTRWGKDNVGTVEDARDLVDELDAGAAGERRGEIWRTLHRATGAWRNDNPGAVVRPITYRPAQRIVREST